MFSGGTCLYTCAHTRARAYVRLVPRTIEKPSSRRFQCRTALSVPLYWTSRKFMRVSEKIHFWQTAADKAYALLRWVRIILFSGFVFHQSDHDFVEVMAYVVMTYMVMAYIVMTYRYGPYGYGLYSYGL